MRAGSSSEARADLRPLFDEAYGLVPGQATIENLALALERWCQRSVCSAPFEVTQSDGFRQIATFDYGATPRASTFVGSVYEGQPGVYGLPLQAPPQYQWVACPTENVRRVTWADLDGDGWWEQLVVQTIGDQGRNVITACGTQVQMEPFEMVDGEGLWVYAVTPTVGGGDFLLIGSVPPYPAGTVYMFDGTRLVDQHGTFAFRPPMNGEPGRSTGCGTGEPGTPALLNHTFEYVGGTDLSTSTALAGFSTNTLGDVIETTPFRLCARPPRSTRRSNWSWATATGSP